VYEEAAALRQGGDDVLSGMGMVREGGGTWMKFGKEVQAFFCKSGRWEWNHRWMSIVGSSFRVCTDCTVSWVAPDMLPIYRSDVKSGAWIRIRDCDEG
jgi:hypothetical protein